MNIYLCSQDENCDYDTYDSFVCYAETEEQARNIYPTSPNYNTEPEWDTWASSPEKVTVELLGTALPGSEVGVICSSFNAGWLSWLYILDEHIIETEEIL